MRDLDSVYRALKAAETTPVTTEVGTLRDEAVNAMAKYTAAVCWHSTQEERAYEELYRRISPKALVIITMVMGVLADMAEGKTDPALDSFLKGLANGVS